MHIDQVSTAHLIRGWHFAHVMLTDATDDFPAWPSVEAKLELTRARYVAVILFSNGIRVFAADRRSLIFATGEAYSVPHGAESAMVSGADPDVFVDEQTAFDLSQGDGHTLHDADTQPLTAR